MDHERTPYVSCNTLGYKQLVVASSRYNKQTINPTWSYKWLGSRRRRGNKEKKWSLSLSTLGRSPLLPSHLSTVKCVGKTFITSMALLRVNSYCNNNHHMRTYKKRAWLALALTLLPPLLWLNQENSVSNIPFQPAVTQAPEWWGFIFLFHIRIFL